jgi:hypothetical protein
MKRGGCAGEEEQHEEEDEQQRQREALPRRHGASASMPAGVFDLVMLPCCRSPRSIYSRSVDLHVKQPRTKEDSESEIEATEFISNPQKKEEFATESEQAVSDSVSLFKAVHTLSHVMLYF